MTKLNLDEAKDLLIQRMTGEPVDLEVYGKDKADYIAIIADDFQNKWESVEVTPEGPTPEQDKELNRILDISANKLIELVNNNKYGVYTVSRDGELYID